MDITTQTARVLGLVQSRGMVRPKDLADLGIPSVVLTRLAADGRIERVSRGLYRAPGRRPTETESLELLAIKAPRAVFCLLTALQVHDLTTQLPRQVWIAMPRGSHAPTIEYPPIRMIQFSGDAYAEGVEIIERDSVSLRVYGVAKTVADCFKYRNKIGLDVALEALKVARSTGKAPADDLWRFAKICRVANVMRPYLEALG